MSDRANYIVVYRGKRSVYYAAWGGPTVPREVQHGPRACVQLIRGQTRVRDESLLEFVFMEGAIAVDKDKKRALFFGGPGDVNYHPEVQARLLERLRPVWAREGYTIDWARRYAYDVVEFVGLPGTTIEDEIYLGDPLPWEQVVEPLTDFTGTVLGRRIGDSWELKASSYRPGALIHHGSRILQAFDDFPACPPLDAYEAKSMTTLLFDAERRTLVIIAPLFASLNAPHFLAERARMALPDFRVELDIDLPLPQERLLARGVALPRKQIEQPMEAPTPPLTVAEIDRIIDAALAYAPEEQIEALEAALQTTVEGIVADAEANGQTVHVVQNLVPRKKKAPARQPKARS